MDFILCHVYMLDLTLLIVILNSNNLMVKYAFPFLFPPVFRDTRGMAIEPVLTFLL